MTATQGRHKVVSREEWLKARIAHLAAEKEFTRRRDELSRAATRTAVGESREGLRLRRSLAARNRSPISSPAAAS